MTFRTFLLILFSCISTISVMSQNDQINSLKNFENSLDSIVNNAINQEAFPGCVVYVAINDSVVLNKPYGYHTYDSAQTVARTDIYDLASITKVVGATLALMKLYEEGYYNLDNPIKHYVKKVGRLKRLTFRQLLAHQAGLAGWIPYFDRFSKKNESFKRKTILNTTSGNYQIDEDQSLHPDIYRKIKQEIRRSKIDRDPEYRYSGIFFYLVPEIVECMSGMAYDEYLNENFYSPLGCTTLGFNPLNRFAKEQIVPTEIDTFFRHSPIHGKVHDEGAILMKGISGNAGLFSNAGDLAKVWSMLLNDGVYNNVRYLEESTIQLFTSYQYPNQNNRRGLGFDKPLLEFDARISSISEQASSRSYGHTGYTGTLAWADPENKVLFLFLTNRVYPDRTHKAIYELNVRPSIHNEIYEYISAKDN